MLMFKAAAVRILWLVPDEDDDDVITKKVAKLTTEESKERNPLEYKVKHRGM